MKRIVLPLGAIAIALSSFAGCSKTDTTATTNTTVAQASSGNSTKATDSDPMRPDGATVPSDLDKTVIDAQRCGDLSMAYTGLYTPLLGGSASPEDKAKIEVALKEMKTQVPGRIADELTIIESGLQKANGIAELGTFFASDEYKKANDSVATYLAKECGKPGA